MLIGGDQEVPFKARALPAPSTSTQEVAEAHETE
jgi:hypothetical protein